MSKNMLIDSAHLEEIRVAVVDGEKLDKFDFASPSKTQIKGNIYLGKIVRVEPSLQAAFVDFGGNKHGFLSFSEIHHDYFQIPISDREELNARIQEAMNAQADDDKEGEEEIDAREISRLRYQFYRRYKIQEVIKKRQIVLVQVTKEERGVKGAALTTYISLAGRYCVLMPNMSKGSGISRKISNPKDRQKMKKIVSELNIDNGSTVIRTAGIGHSKLEIKKDFEYLKKLWDDIRNTTLHSTAPSLIYEEANIIKRAIRDLYSKDVESIVVEGEKGYKFTKDLVKKLMPSHAKKVKLYDDKTIPLFSKFKINDQVNQIYSTNVGLPSGGYLVINTTEALVSIDVNSGKSTRARDIAGTAIKTNLEAAVEIARQCRLRDLAGLIVVDFIDMEEKRNNSQVERCLREALREDKAKIQVGTISNFGLLEFSRQRLRSSIADANMVICPHCNGTGLIWSDESIALQVIRKIEETCMILNIAEITVTVSTDIALYILNHKKDFISNIEQRGLKIKFAIDPLIAAGDFKIDHVMKLVVDENEDDEKNAETDKPTKIEQENKGSGNKQNFDKKIGKKKAKNEAKKNENDVSGKALKKSNKRKKNNDKSDKIADVNVTAAVVEETSNANSKDQNQEDAASLSVSAANTSDVSSATEKKSEAETKTPIYNARSLKKQKKRTDKKNNNEETAKAIEELSEKREEKTAKTVFNIGMKKEEHKGKENALAEPQEADPVFVYEKNDFGNLIETYRELEKNAITPPKKSEVMSIPEKRSRKKSGWWQRLLKPTDGANKSSNDTHE